jgi:hypothetical protein
MNLIPVFWDWQRQIGFSSSAKGGVAVRKSSLLRLSDTLSAQFEGELAMVRRSGMSCFPGAAGLRLASLGNADTGQDYPRRGIARRKSFDQALIDFVDRFNLQGPGGCPAFSALMAQYLGRHRFRPKRLFRPQWG